MSCLSPRSKVALLAGALGALSLLACAGGTGSPAASGGATTHTGGAATGGAPTSPTGGAPSGTGGSAGAAAATGGSSTGGAPAANGGDTTSAAGKGGSTSAIGGSGGRVVTGGGGATNLGGAGGQPPTGSVVCPASALPAGNTNHTIASGGRNREYILHVPASYTGKAAVALIVDFHGHGGTGTSQQKDSPYPKVVDAESVLMAFPTAVGDWNMGPCCADGIDDIAFAKAVVADVQRLGCVDPKRIYAAGFSMGGGMSHWLACQAADVFAAVAPAAFDLLQEHLATCKPKRPITVITFRGSNDDLALYNGGLSNLVRPINFLGAIGSMKKWGELDGCTGSPSDLGNNCQGFTASQCAAGVESIVCTKAGGGHEQGNATLQWPVLKRHQLP